MIHPTDTTDDIDIYLYNIRKTIKLICRTMNKYNLKILD